ncbi:MAG: PLP-dependent aminotransferase family protein [Opitutales bacterium]|nr:PLP-dependent aminotransferase family protein [Opitutales bacterium]
MTIPPSFDSIAWSALGKRVEPPVIDSLMADALNIPGMLSLAAGFTDNAVLPSELILEAMSALCDPTGSKECFQYGTNIGRFGLREEALRLLKTYPGEERLDLPLSQVAITNGSQQVLYLSAQVLCDEGDIVFVEDPSYFVLLEMLRGMNLRVLSIPRSESGAIDFEALETLFSELKVAGEWHRVKFIYLIGYFANPSSRSLSEEDKRRLGLLLRAQKRPIPVIEDAAYRNLYFDQAYPARSLLSLPEWAGLPVMYTGTFTKPFATGLKVGYAFSTSAEWMQNVLCVKGHQDFGTANFAQAILEHVLKADLYLTHLRRIRVHYKGKMEVLHRALVNSGLMEHGWSWSVPGGGLYLWLTGPDHVDTSLPSNFCKACLDEKVLYVPGDLCIAGGVRKNCVRLSFGALPESLLEEAAARFAAVALRFS